MNPLMQTQLSDSFPPKFSKVRLYIIFCIRERVLKLCEVTCCIYLIKSLQQSDGDTTQDQNEHNKKRGILLLEVICYYIQYNKNRLKDFPYGLTMQSYFGEYSPHSTLSQTPPKNAFTMPKMFLSTKIRFRVRNTFQNMPFGIHCQNRRFQKSCQKLV